ncbi:MAG: type II secretion system F family protein [Alsobacter sp.]
MDEQTIFYVLVFLATVLIVVSINSSFIAPAAKRRKVNRRAVLLQQGISGAEALSLLRRERWLLEETYGASVEVIRRTMVQSGIPLDPRELGTRLGLILVGSLIITMFVMGVSLTSALVGLLVTVLVAVGYVRYSREKRITKFKEQLPEVLELIVRSLRVGHPLPAAFALAAREMQDPAGTEFGIVSDEIQFGLSVPAAMANLSYRVGDPDLAYVVTAVTIQAQTGGNLAELLARLAKLIRDRYRLGRKVRALTSEARMSAIALSLFPVVLFGIVLVLAPRYYEDAWRAEGFKRILLLCIGMLTLGNVIMRRMANIKV